MFEYVVAGATIFFLIVLSILHTAYVGNTGCLPQLLSEYAQAHNMTSFQLKSDQLLGINVDYKYSPLMASAEREQMIKSQDDSYERRLRRRLAAVSDGASTSSRFNMASHWRFLEDTDSTKSSIFKSYITTDNTNDGNNVSLISDANLTLSEKYDYVFALEYSLVTMPAKMLKEHNFQVINITMVDNPSCYGPSYAQPFLGLGGFDTVMQNNLMYTLEKGVGYIYTHTCSFMYSYIRIHTHTYILKRTYILILTSTHSYSLVGHFNHRDERLLHMGYQRYKHVS